MGIGSARQHPCRPVLDMSGYGGDQHLRHSRKHRQSYSMYIQEIDVTRAARTALQNRMGNKLPILRGYGKGYSVFMRLWVYEDFWC